MRLIQITPELLPKILANASRFLRHNGDRRITLSARKWFNNLSPEDLSKPGTEILMMVLGHRIVGISAISFYGIDQSIIAVHRDYRNQGIGEQLVRFHIQSLGKLYARVAVDNQASLKLCFTVGMVAFQLFNGPTGKPTLWLAGGDWKREDIETQFIEKEGDPPASQS